jgi:ABC-type phosphate/phosphonate transport system permease subunit
MLINEGYAVKVCRSFEEFTITIKTYMQSWEQAQNKSIWKHLNIWPIKMLFMVS